jgi:hypothetical protein
MSSRAVYARETSFECLEVCRAICGARPARNACIRPGTRSRLDLVGMLASGTELNLTKHHFITSSQIEATKALSSRPKPVDNGTEGCGMRVD